MAADLAPEAKIPRVAAGLNPEKDTEKSAGKSVKRHIDLNVEKGEETSVK